MVGRKRHRPVLEPRERRLSDSYKCRQTSKRSSCYLAGRGPETGLSRARPETQEANLT